MKSKHLFALILIGIGLIIFLSAAGILFPFNTWLLVPLVLGLIIANSSKHFNLLSLALVLISLYAIARESFLFYNVFTLPDIIRWKYLLPALLIIWGISILFKPQIMIHHCKKYEHEHQQSNIADQPSSSYGKRATSNASFNSDTSAFSGDNFNSGSISVSFGESNVDLTDVITVDATFPVYVSVSFGSANITIPESWSVDKSKVSSAFGSVDMKNSAPVNPAVVLVLTGSVNFGSIVIKNKK